MEEKVDLRIRKTMKALIGALQSLLKEKDFDDITVTELCERAETRKATFYKHFGDKYELFVYMIRELERRYEEENKREYEGQPPQAFYTGIIRYTLDFLLENEEMVKRVLRSAARPTLTEIITEQVEFTLRDRFKEDMEKFGYTSASPDLLAAIFSGAFIRSACWWITHKYKMSKEEMVRQVTGIIQNF